MPLVASTAPKKAAEPSLLAALERLRKGDRSALSPILDLSRPRLFRFCFYLTGDFATAEELAQETFLKGLGHLESLKDLTKIYPWLFRIARNLYIDATRTPEHQLMRRQLKGQEETDRFFDTLPDESRVEAETTLAVRDALARLPAEDRAILILVDQEECSYEEAAKTLGIAHASLRFRLARARKAFLDLYGERRERK